MKQVFILTFLVLTLCFQVFGQEKIGFLRISNKNVSKLEKASQLIQDNRIDQYGKMIWQDEQIRLQNVLLVELINLPEMEAYFIFSYQKKSELKFIKLRQKKILKLIKSQKISISRIKMFFINSQFYQTDIWLLPKGVPPN